MSLPSTTRIRSGELLDHYRLEYLVTASCMAYVFRATDTKTGRAVAIKIPHPKKAADRRARDRFLYETKIGAQFDHPGLVKVLPNGSANHRYAVMEWVEGRLLRDDIDEDGHLPAERAIRISLAVCDALDYLHGHGVGHNDLKPENVMIDADDNIKLIDLGIAREIKMTLWRRLRPNEGIGTPDYMSPERIQGKPGDARSDVYSLGIMLYEMLAGEVPFSGLAPSAAVALRSLQDAPCVSEINPGVSPRLRDVVRRALARDPEKRIASVREFAACLSEALAEEMDVRASESESLASV